MRTMRHTLRTAPPRHTGAVVVLSLLLVVLAGCSQRENFRYKLVITVEYNGKEYSGTNVVQCSEYSDPGYLDWAHVLHQELHGEANVVALPDGRLIVGILSQANQHAPRENWTAWISGCPTTLIRRAYDMGGGPVRDGYIHDMDGLSQQSGPKPIGVDDLPDMVSFTNNNDPSSVILVDPHDMFPSMGPGVRFARATIEVTHDPLTRGIEKYLPWVAGLKTALDGQIGVNVLQPTLANQLSAPNFRSEH